MKAKNRPLNFNPRTLESDLIREATSLRIPKSVAQNIAQKVTNNLTQWLEKRPLVTDSELNFKIAKELAKYHSDLAYVYQNRDKII